MKDRRLTGRSGKRIRKSLRIPAADDDLAKRPSMSGRPGYLTEELEAQICRYLRAGAYIETAAIAAGISKETLYEWFNRGREAKIRGTPDQYTRFADAVSKAMAEWELRDLANIDRAAMGVRDPSGKQIEAPDWKASAWRLERKLPKKWGRKDSLRVAPGERTDHDDADSQHAAVLGLIEEARAKRAEDDDEKPDR